MLLGWACGLVGWACGLGVLVECWWFGLCWLGCGWVRVVWGVCDGWACVGGLGVLVGWGVVRVGVCVLFVFFDIA